MKALYNSILGCFPVMSNKEREDESVGSPEAEGVEASKGLKSEEIFVEKQLETLTWLNRSSWRIKIFEEDSEDLPGTTMRIYRDASEHTDVTSELLDRVFDGFNPESYELTFSLADEEVWITFRDIDVVEVKE